MKKVLLAAVVALGFVLTGCGGAKLSPEVAENFDSHATLYTTRNMHYNVSRRAKIVDTTNYQVGILIPVNSEVTMDSVNRNQIVFTYKGQDIILRNRVKYTGVGIDEIAKRYFSAKKVDLSKFSKKEQQAIRIAQVIPGMSKKAVLISLGTPPAHVTPTTEMNQWRYWRTRWSTFFINFKDGKAINSSAPSENAKHGLSLQIR
jgi:hypothetical protein